ncbi:MAG: peptidase M23 [Piscirickettsiaceae bacterium]|nr:MAG: peptidase M23 [Piscirickettsiaceae bacterium]
MLNCRRCIALVISLVVCCAVLASCSTNKIHAPVLNQNNPIKQSATSYVVKRSDTLYSIAWQSGKDYQDIAKWNSIARPYIIYIGQPLRLVPKKTYKKVLVTKKIKQKIYKKHIVKANTSNNYKKTFKLNWQWPIRVRRLESDKSRTGVTVVGKLGELVKSGESGKVVYAGNGLKGYGNLLIIKHNEEFLSAYGFNKRLLVKEGSFVKKGQTIAEIGLDNKRRPVLFFEIRRHGKPVSVTRYMPKLKRG